jgi:DNA invertase Pin-like site-specific DNA recombinase
MTDTNTIPPAPSRPKAFSYLRFSTPEQSKGDSFRRQTSMAQDYARRHGLDLDERLTFHDVGVSAFRGQNADVGRLAYFLEAVETGLVPQGSLLLVEQLDRLSRLTPRRAMKVLDSIVDAGVGVVTLNDERVYTSASMDRDVMDLMVSVLTFMRANEESATKSRRGSQTWEAKRAAAATTPLTSKAPAWLRLDRGAGRFELIPERADVVRRIFAMTIEGAGQHKIAETFNREGLKPWGSASHWQRSYIAKVLANPAAIGTMTPHIMEHQGGIKRRKAQEPLVGYYPAVVSPETFADVQALQTAHSAPSRGRHAAQPISNILAGLAACPSCGRTMTRVQKGARSKPSFVCTAAKAGAGCPYKSVPYAWVEEALLRGLPPRLANNEGVDTDDDLERTIVNAEHDVDRLKHAAANLLDNLSHGHSPSLAARLRETEGELEAAESELRSLLERREAVSGLLVAARIAKAIAALQPPEGEVLDRAQANLGLRSLFKRAVINWPQGAIELEWTHGGTCEVPYGWAQTGG